MSEMLSWLSEYLNNTPIEEVRKEWEKVEALELRAPNAYDYIDFLFDFPCDYESPPKNELELLYNKMDSKFFGVHFFCLNLHHERATKSIFYF